MTVAQHRHSHRMLVIDVGLHEWGTTGMIGLYAFGRTHTFTSLDPSQKIAYKHPSEVITPFSRLRYDALHICVGKRTKCILIGGFAVEPLGVQPDYMSTAGFWPHALLVKH